MVVEWWFNGSLILDALMVVSFSAMTPEVAGVKFIIVSLGNSRMILCRPSLDPDPAMILTI